LTFEFRQERPPARYSTNVLSIGDPGNARLSARTFRYKCELAVSPTIQTPFTKTVQILNRVFWFASIGVWICIVIRSGILSGRFPPDLFFPNFVAFLLTGAAVVATTHFFAAMLPLGLGVTLLVGDITNAKGVWALVTAYIVSAIVIGFFAGLSRLFRFLAHRRERQELEAVLARDRQELEASLARDTPTPPRG
jgi:hypothetical protein